MEGRIRTVTDMAAPLAAVTDPGARSVYVKYLAETVDIEEAAILEKIRPAANRPTAAAAAERRSRETPAEQTGLALAPSSRIERQLVAMMLQYPDILPEIREQRIVSLMADPALQRIAQDVLDGRQDVFPEGDGDDAEYDRIRRLKARLSIPQEAWDYRGCLRIIQHFAAIRRRQQAAALDEQIRQAEKNHDEKRLQQLLKARQEQVARVRGRQTAGFTSEVD